jgi:hypothetical protein
MDGEVRSVNLLGCNPKDILGVKPRFFDSFDELIPC